MSSNFYWLSTQPDVIDWTAPDYPAAQLKTYADFTGLQDLQPAKVSVAWNSVPGDPDQVDNVTVRNESKNLAFFVHLTVLKGQNGGDVAPVYWSDNYFPLLPGESRLVTATYPQKLLDGAVSYIQVDGWNVVAK